FTTETPSPAIGIDLGTTYSCVAVCQNGRVEIIPNDHGNRTTPSCVAFTPTGRLIGEAAKYQAHINPSNTIFDVKRLIGRKSNDEALLKDMKRWPFKVNAEEIKPKIVVTYKGEEKSFVAEEISAMILCRMKEFAEAYLGTSVKDVVVTVPAYFNNLQRQATKDAGTIAGLNVMRIINEPTAAAIAYGLHRMTNDRKNVLVFDLGGGTFDVSLVIIENAKFEVKSVSGDTNLGGRDFDNRIIECYVTEIQRKYGKNIRENYTAIEKLRGACERAKRILSTATSTCIVIDDLFEGFNFSSTITRVHFQKLNMDLFEECLCLCCKCLVDANFGEDDINEILLVGGSSRIPMVGLLLQGFFCWKELCKSINPEEAVAYGAAAQAALLSGTDHMSFSVVDVTPYSLGIEYCYDPEDKGIVIPRNTPIPTRTQKLLCTTEDNQCTPSFKVFEGEGSKVKDHCSLGVYKLHNIAPGHKGVPKVNICFEISADGILKCSNQDLEIGSMNGIPFLNRSGRLSEKEVDKMMQDAAKFKLEDDWQGLRVKARNDLEKYTKTISDLLRDHGKKISSRTGGK
ncbi:heat shock 70 kDa protein II-like, partial [Chenopodium quinoa]|uniref:heat shock 70 kDa protein II-like n=1 Tax=Chenopodium quinoa TaxID=63459 RepID=UPI000B798A48